MKHLIRTLFAVCLLGLLTAAPAKAAVPSTEDAISNALAIAADNRHGYSQSNRWGNPDYDCSSFMYTVFQKAGFALPTSGDRYTQTMIADFKKAGFEWIPWSSIGGASKLIRGDILLNATTCRHCELYLGDGMLVGAHHDYGSPKSGDQSGKEISTGGYYFLPWTGVLRYVGTAALQNTEGDAAQSVSPVKSVKITGAVKTLKAGKKVQLKATVKADAGTTKKVKWVTSNKKYATVTSTGKVRAKKAGKGKTVKITAVAKGDTSVKKTIKIKIK